MKNLKIIIIKKDSDYDCDCGNPPKWATWQERDSPNPNLQLYTKKIINHGLQMLALTCMMEDTDSKASAQEGDQPAQGGAPSDQAGNPTGQTGNPSVQEGTPSGKEANPSDQAGNPSDQAGNPSVEEGAPSAQEGNTAGQEVEKHINLKVIIGREILRRWCDENKD